MLLAIFLATGGVRAQGSKKAGFAMPASMPPDSFFVALEHQWLHALQQNDTVFLNRLLAGDFMDITHRGTVRSKKDQLQSRSYPGGMTQQLDSLRVRQYKSAVLVTGINRIHIKQVSQPVIIRFTDVFVKRNGRWQAVSAQETLEK